MKFYKKVIVVILVICMMLSCTGCDENPKTVDGFTYQWINSSIFETIDKTADISLKDDFAAAVNHDWSTRQIRDFSYNIGPFGDTSKTVMENKRALIEDETVHDNNIEIIRVADGLFDMEYRDSLGVEPLKKYLEYIDDIKSLDDVSAYMIDNDRNPFAASLVDINYLNDEAVDDVLTLNITRPELTLEDNEYYVEINDEGFMRRQKVESRVTYILDRCGYSMSEINKIITRGFRFESELVHLDFADFTDYKNAYSKDEILDIAKSYPLDEMLEHYSLTNCEYFTGELSYLGYLKDIYKEENVLDIKSYFIMRLCLDSMQFLDSGAFDCLMETNLDLTNPYEERIEKDQEYYFDLALKKSNLSAALDQAYIEYYFNENVYDDMIGMIHDLKAMYKKEISSSSTLTDDGKKAVINKLENISEFVMKPSNTADYSDVDLIPAEEGGSFLDAICQLSKKKYLHISDMVQNYKSKICWDIYASDTSTTNTNSYYYPPMNSIFIDIGILAEPAYSVDDPYEKRLAYIGTILGHELSHAFDSHGIHYDSVGNFKDIISSDELKNWSDMSNRIFNQLGSFESFEGAGKYTKTNDITGETIADIEGTRVCLMLAKNRESFDYDAFFRYYAEHWAKLEAKRDIIYRIKNDPHPLNYLRVNYVLMQFEEFYDTYDIGPGDGMYIEPEYRVVIW
ncbi:MAG: M13 family metallopeptidase [Eubacterium sp.]|nr:M13 family metallopeptidase [Eubacterium sp.]